MTDRDIPPDWRQCGHCGCKTNAKVRACCDKGRAEDRTASAAPATAPEQPAWHDAPDVAALKAERDAAMKDAERYRWLTTHARTTSEHWGGRWSIVIDGPVPKRNDCEDAFDEAIDAAMKEEA